MTLVEPADKSTAHMLDLQELIEERTSEPTLLLPELLSRTDGVGPAVALGPNRGKLLVATLAINHVVEHGGLVLSIWGSADGLDWGSKPLATFPQKYYCGLYSALLNLAARPDVCFVRPEWKIKAWNKGVTLPLFSFHMFLEESGARIATA